MLTFGVGCYLKKLNFSHLPYNKHVINQALSVHMGESWFFTDDLGQDFPITDYLLG